MIPSESAFQEKNLGFSLVSAAKEGANAKIYYVDGKIIGEDIRVGQFAIMATVGGKF